MTVDEALQQIARVIEKTNNLEMRIAHCLSRCLIPAVADYGFFRELVFHNTLLSFSAKVQLMEHICDYWSRKDLKSQLGRFKELMKLRNAFAHIPLAKKELLVYFPPECEYGSPLGSQFVVEKKTPVSWENVEREAAFQQFEDLHSKCLATNSDVATQIEKTIVQQQVKNSQIRTDD